MTAADPKRSLPRPPGSPVPVKAPGTAVSIDSGQLFAPGQTTLVIAHGGQRYLLRVTRENKLILTK